MQSGAAVEVGTIGREGFFGLELMLGATQWTETTLCQVEGDSLRMSASAFQGAITADTGLRRIAQRYLMAYLALVSQSVACNRLHNIEERFARWVLMTHDRVDGDEFFLTQEFIADMLGVHRPSVSLVAGAFQQAGFIKYSRGAMTIVNREGLEAASCECYRASTDQFARLLALVDTYVTLRSLHLPQSSSAARPKRRKLRQMGGGSDVTYSVLDNEIVTINGDIAANCRLALGR